MKEKVLIDADEKIREYARRYRFPWKTIMFRSLKDIRPFMPRTPEIIFI